jgi:hypothetical protein
VFYATRHLHEIDLLAVHTVDSYYVLRERNDFLNLICFRPVSFWRVRLLYVVKEFTVERSSGRRARASRCVFPPCLFLWRM